MIPGSPMMVDEDDQCLDGKRTQPLQQQLENGNNTTHTSSSSKKRKKREDKSTASASASASTSRSNKARRGGATAAAFAGAAASATTTASSSGPVLEYQDFCELPLTLKTVLVDEVERITRRDSASSVHHHAHFCSNIISRSNNNNMTMQQQPQPLPRRPPARLVHDLPATVTIQQVLKHFCKKQQKANKQQQAASAAANNAAATDPPPPTQQQSPPPLQATDEQVQNFCQGLTNLFQEALPTVLLYPQERPQYEALVKRYENENNSNNINDKNMPQQQQQWTEIYGCEYLLRLYVRLPLLMQNPNNIHPVWTTTEQGNGKSSKSGTIMADDIRIVGPLLTQLLVLLQKNRQACFKGSSSYREPKPDEWTEQERRIMMMYGGGDDYHAEWNHHPQQHHANAAAAAAAATTSSTATATARDHSSMDTL